MTVMVHTVSTVQNQRGTSWTQVRHVLCHTATVNPISVKWLTVGTWGTRNFL